MPPPRQKPELAIIKDNSRGKARDANVIKRNPVDRVPSCPKSLSHGGKQVWKQIVPKLVKMGVVEDIDVFALEMYCETYAQWHRAKTVLAENGDTYINEKGEPKARPEVGIAKNALDHLIRFGGKFGLTTYDRNSITIKEPDTSDEKKKRHFS